MILFMGVDPGQSGAVAVISSEREIVRIEDWPGDEIQAAGVIRSIIVNSGGWEIHAAIEKVSAMPKQGVVSMFKFGMNYGIWQGLLAAAQIPFVLVAPRVWQKGVISKAQDKKPSVAAAGRMFPNAELFGPRGGKKDGRADALLIADYCRRQHIGLA